MHANQPDIPAYDEMLTLHSPCGLDFVLPFKSIGHGVYQAGAIGWRHTVPWFGIALAFGGVGVILFLTAYRGDSQVAAALCFIASAGMALFAFVNVHLIRVVVRSGQSIAILIQSGPWLWPRRVSAQFHECNIRRCTVLSRTALNRKRDGLVLVIDSATTAVLLANSRDASKLDRYVKSLPESLRARYDPTDPQRVLVRVRDSFRD